MSMRFREIPLNAAIVVIACSILLVLSACVSTPFTDEELKGRYRDVPFVSLCRTGSGGVMVTNRQEIAELWVALDRAAVNQSEIAWIEKEAEDIVWVGYPCRCPACGGKSCLLCRDKGYGVSNQLYNVMRIQSDGRVGLDLLEVPEDSIQLRRLVTPMPGYVAAVMSLWERHRLEAIDAPIIMETTD